MSYYFRVISMFACVLIACCGILSTCVQVSAQVYNITTIAGGASSVGWGEGGMATAASLQLPGSIAWRNNELFIVERDRYRVLKVSSSGIISRFAGVGTQGSSGDGGLATLAMFYLPQHVSVDSNGHVYISDTNNNKIRVVYTNGIINSVAGNTTAGYSGDGGLATSALLSSPRGISFNSSDIIFADYANGAIRKISNSIISTIARYTPSGSKILPKDVAINSNGEVFIADYGYHYIYKILTNGSLTVVAGNGVATFNGDGLAGPSTSLNQPTSLVFNSVGELIFCDYGNSRIRKVKTDGKIETIAGSGTYYNARDGISATSVKLYQPSSVEVDSQDQVLFSEDGIHKIRKILSNGTLVTVAGNGAFADDNGLAGNGQLKGPRGVAFTSGGEMLIADTSHNAIRKVDLNGILSTITGNAVISTSYPGYYGTLYFANCVTVHPLTGDIYIGTYTAIMKYSISNGFLSVFAGDITTTGNTGDGGLATSAKLYQPYGLAFDSVGNLIISDTYNNRIRKVDSNGIITAIANTAGSYGYNSDGILAINSHLYGPYSVFVSKSNEIYLADTNNNRIRKIDSNGYISTIAGNGTQGFSGDGGLATSATLNQPTGVTVNSAGVVFISDTGNNRIRIVYTNGIIGTIAGNGTSGYSEQSNLALSTPLSAPIGVTIGPDGNIYVADSGNNRIRKISVACGGSTQLVEGICVNITSNSTNYSNSTTNSTIISTNSTLNSTTNSTIPTNSTTNSTSPTTSTKPVPVTSTPTAVYSSLTSKNNIVSSGNDLVSIIVPSVVVPIFAIILILIIIIIIVIAIKLRKPNSSKNLTKLNDIEMANTSQIMTVNQSSDFPSDQSNYLYTSSLNSSNGTSPNNAIDKYNIIEKVGQGAFGSVFKAQDKKKGGIVAIKVLKYIDNEELNQIMKEGIQLMKIDHPNIVKVHDMFLDSTQMVYMEMEFYGHGDLNVLINSKENYSESFVSKILEQSCLALQYIHEKFKIIHRDIKPSNIFIKSIDVSNNDIQIVLADFGLAKDTQGSVAKSFAGTPLYMPPELSLGVNYSFNADVYSMGVTMFQLMTKDLQTSISYLYMTKDVKETREILRNKMKVSNNYSDKLIEIILDMMEKDMEKRPSESQILKRLHKQ